MTPKHATEFANDRLNISEEQSQKISLFAKDLFFRKKIVAGNSKSRQRRYSCANENQNSRFRQIGSGLNRKIRSAMSQAT